MSKIKELIKEKCPNGVEYYKLSEISEKFTGLSGKSKADFQSGNCRYITYTNIYNNPSVNLYTNDFVNIKPNEKQNIIKFKDILIAGSSENLEDSGMISVVTSVPSEKIYLNSFCFGLRLTKKYFYLYNADFLKHLFRSKKIRSEIIKCSFGVTRYNLSKDKLLKIKIPCPPIEVQEEIVRILDKFSELEFELKSELEARKKQHEFWNKKLYEFTNDIKYFPIEQVCNFLVGGDIPKYNFSKNKTDIFSIPIYSNGVEENALYGYTNRARINQKCVTVSARGTIGYAAIRESPFYPIVRLICVIPNNKLNVRFLKYYFDTLNFKVPTTGIPQLTVPMLKKYNVPVPSLAEQELIVKNLDKFDKLINDISEGIPAEIEARRKQYDYYRNKLLSFEVQDNDRTTK